MTHIRGQSEAARNARLDRGCCPTHGIGMGQLAGWWYPLDEPPFTLVKCDRSDCDVICKSQGPEGPLSAPLTQAELKAIHAEHGMRWTIEYYAHFMYKTALDKARMRRDAGDLSAHDYDKLAQGAEQIKDIARMFIVALYSTNEEREQ